MHQAIKDFTYYPKLLQIFESDNYASNDAFLPLARLVCTKMIALNKCKEKCVFYFQARDAFKPKYYGVLHYLKYPFFFYKFNKFKIYPPKNTFYGPLSQFLVLIPKMWAKNL